jgi:diketogulonate reductase-like aldo/keto reductase
MPMVGFGTWKLPNGMTEDIVYESIKVGYRHIDCAAVYGNEVEVGRGINRAINENIVTREELFITSKLWNTYHRREHVKPALLRSLKDLDLKYLDLYLMHYPLSLKYVDPAVAYPALFYYEPKGEKEEIIMDKVPII